MTQVFAPLCIALAALALATSPASAEDAAHHAYTPPPPKEGYSYPECYCTNSTGGRVEVGELACLTIGGRQVMSRCEKRRNLVIWKHQSEGCPPGV